MFEELDLLIDRKANKFHDASDSIWEFAEEGYKEFKSSKLQKKMMEEEGFKIEDNVAEIETAFIARYGTEGVVIGFLGEFDALPGLSQKADSLVQEKIKEDKNSWGHGCGHNLLGVACMQAAIALKDYLEEHNIKGSIIYYGCPAEEGGAGKAFMAREDAFKDADICLTWHPNSITTGAMGTLANTRVYYNFKGISSHAAAAPHLGRSALDSVELMNIGVNYLREHIIPEARIHYAITDPGGSAPNVVQDKAQVLYAIRAPENDQLVDILERVNKIAKGAAMMSGTEVEIKIVSAYANILRNETLDYLIFKHIKELYPLDYNDEEKEYASKYFEIVDKTEVEVYKSMAKKYFKTQDILNGPLSDIYLPPSNIAAASSDVGDVSWNIPTSWFIGEVYTLGTPVHSWLAVAQGKSSIAKRGMDTAAKVLARSALEIYLNPEIVESAKKDYLEELGERRYKSIIPEDVNPGNQNKRRMKIYEY